MIEGEFDQTDFALYLMHKDTRYAVALAEKLGAPHDVIARGGGSLRARGSKGTWGQGFRGRRHVGRPGLAEADYCSS